MWGRTDLASARAGCGPRGRAAVMYGPAGFAYVYLVYACTIAFNAVTEAEGYPGAVLVRAIEPADNARGRRGAGPVARLPRSRIRPRSCTAWTLTSSHLTLKRRRSVADSGRPFRSPIGVDYAGECSSLPVALLGGQARRRSRSRLHSGSPLESAMFNEAQVATVAPRRKSSILRRRPANVSLAAAAGSRSVRQTAAANGLQSGFKASEPARHAGSGTTSQSACARCSRRCCSHLPVDERHGSQSSRGREAFHISCQGHEGSGRRQRRVRPRWANVTHGSSY